MFTILTKVISHTDTKWDAAFSKKI